jgi:hypothetical protein
MREGDPQGDQFIRRPGHGPYAPPSQQQQRRVYYWMI